MLDYLKFLRQAPGMENMLINSGSLLLEDWFSVSRE
jgi:polyphosphate kinase 2 (PPK2 family)